MGLLLMLFLLLMVTCTPVATPRCRSPVCHTPSLPRTPHPGLLFLMCVDISSGRQQPIGAGPKDRFVHLALVAPTMTYVSFGTYPEGPAGPTAHVYTPAGRQQPQPSSTPRGSSCAVLQPSQVGACSPSAYPALPSLRSHAFLHSRPLHLLAGPLCAALLVSSPRLNPSRPRALLRHHPILIPVGRLWRPPWEPRWGDPTLIRPHLPPEEEIGAAWLRVCNGHRMGE